MEKEKVCIVGIQRHEDDQQFKASMDELEQLVEAAHGEVVLRVVQKRDKVESRTYIGKGKIEELVLHCDAYELDTIVFNDELSGSQSRNIADALPAKIIDRTGLILDIFAMRATSAEGVHQVALAQLQYRLPRLVGLRDNLSRTGGGIGTRGPGEQQLETDRRHLLRQMHQTQKALEIIEKTRETTRKKRIQSGYPMIALVGYTNAGKSTIMNGMLQANKKEMKQVYVEDQLFATLDTTMRHITLPHGNTVLLSDTVGFVSKLPHSLVAAFKGTLEEVLLADVILHVIDASDADSALQIETTRRILEDMGVMKTPIITVINKIDKVEHVELMGTILGETSIAIQARKQADIERLMLHIERCLEPFYTEIKMLLSYDKMAIISELVERFQVTVCEYRDHDVYIEAIVPKHLASKYRSALKNPA